MAYRGGVSFGFGMGLTPWVKRLMIVNGMVFLLQFITGNGNAAASAFTDYLAFVPARALFTPWTIVTYMFAHGGFWHLFFNMLGLFFFGPPLEARWGSREFLKYYLICGLGGAALSFALAFGSPIIGASAAVYGVMLAFAMNWPDMPIYIWGIFPVPAKYLVGIFALMSFLSMVSPRASDNVAHAAHLGGFVAGFLYLKLDRPGGLFAGMKKGMKRRRLTVVPGEAEQPRAPQPSAPAARRSSVAREEGLLDELDRVLDKISTEGMGSLTAEERRLLDEVSKRYRQN